MSFQCHSRGHNPGPKYPSAAWAEQDVSSKSCRCQSPAFPHSLQRAPLVTRTPQTANVCAFGVGKHMATWGACRFWFFKTREINSALGGAQEHECGSQGTQEEHTCWEQKASVGVSECKGLPGASADTRQMSQHQLELSDSDLDFPSFHYTADTRS